MKDLKHYQLFAEIFKYPGKETKAKIAEVKDFLDLKYPDAANEITRFTEFIERSNDSEIEEIFGKTFHIQAICFLDLGYVIFGEDYKRGEFLVNMKKEQRDNEIDCGEELADNLPNVLRLLAIHKDENFINEFVVMILIPALEKMLSEFDDMKTQIREKVMNKKQKVIIMKGIKDGNIYKNALSAMLMVFKKDFEDIKYESQVEIIPPYAKAFVHAECDEGCGTKTPTPEQIKQRSMTII
ncbi:MAG: hypothetical protein KDD29_01770 [Flavobacteriales bacterium]|nr:hypothetical protein [Flavobacteriales bacterium]